MGQLYRSALCGIAALTVAGCGESHPTVQPFPPERIELTTSYDNQIVHLADNGIAYREVDSGEKWEFFANVYDPELVKQSYLDEDGRTFRLDPDNRQRRFEVRRDLADSFEDLSLGRAGVAGLVNEERQVWGSFTLQSPKTPTVSEYVKLRNEIVRGQADFLDSRVEPTTERAHTGKVSIKCVAAAKTSDMVTSKASLSSPLVYFRNAEDFWFEAYYWIEGEMPLTIMDLESEFIEQHSGIRVRLYDNGSLGAELKALNKPQFRQPQDQQVIFPRGQWVCVRVHFYLSATDGVIEIFQDGQQVLQAKGSTLPFRSAIYNSLEVGISAHSNDRGPSTVFIDGVRVASKKWLD